MGAFLCRVCMLSPWTRGFSPGATVSFHRPKTCTWSPLVTVKYSWFENEREWVFVFKCPCDGLVSWMYPASHTTVTLPLSRLSSVLPHTTLVKGLPTIGTHPHSACFMGPSCSWAHANYSSRQQPLIGHDHWMITG